MRGAYVYSDKNSNYEQLLEKDGSVSIHNRNLQILPLKCSRFPKICQSLLLTISFKERKALMI